MAGCGVNMIVYVTIVVTLSIERLHEGNFVDGWYLMLVGCAYHVHSAIGGQEREGGGSGRVSE